MDKEELLENENIPSEDPEYLCNEGLRLINTSWREEDQERGAAYIKKAAEQNHPEALRVLAALYTHGNHVPKDRKKALQYLEHAGELGNAAAQYELGSLYEGEEDVPCDMQKSLYWMNQAAEQGNVDAMTHLGTVYFRGSGTPKDYKKAAKWFLKAAEQGNDSAYVWLRNMYRDGSGVEKDLDKALYYGDLADENSSLRSDHEQWKYKRAEILVEQAAEQGDAEAQYKLGLRYDYGDADTLYAKDEFSWMSKAAEQGHAGAMAHLGSMYYKGKGVPEDRKKATEWFLKAAEQGDHSACVRVRDMYLNGYGVRRDNGKALYYGDLADKDETDPAAREDWKKKRERILEEIEEARKEAERKAAEEEERKRQEEEEEKHGTTQEKLGIYCGILFLIFVFIHRWGNLHRDASWLLVIPAMGLGAVGSVLFGGGIMMSFTNSYIKSGFLTLLLIAAGLVGSFLTVYHYDRPIYRQVAVVIVLVIIVLLLVKAVIKKLRK